MKPTPHIKESKRKEVEHIKSLLKEYHVVAILNLQNLPAFNYMKIKHSLRGKIVLKYTKKRLMKIAFDEASDSHIKVLKDRLVGIPALLFTNEEPFRLAQLLKKSKSNAPAKPGDIAPIAVVIPAGPTEFTPGPMIGELGALGIKTQVMEGKIHIRAEKVLVKAGETISEKFAALMGKLKMEPMTIGFNLVLTYQQGEILEGSVLDVDAEQYEHKVSLAASESMNLALFIGFISPDTIEPLIMKASREGDALIRESHLQERLDQLLQKQSHSPEKKPLAESLPDLENTEVSQVAASASKELMKQAGDLLKDLTDKKIRGEI